MPFVCTFVLLWPLALSFVCCSICLAYLFYFFSLKQSLHDAVYEEFQEFWDGMIRNEMKVTKPRSRGEAENMQNGGC